MRFQIALASKECEFEDDGFLSVAMRNRNKAWKKAKGKYFFVPFTNN